MAKRDMVKTAARVRGIDQGNYSITVPEMYELMEMARTVGAADAIALAFDYGYVLGHRATEAGKYKERTGRPQQEGRE